MAEEQLQEGAVGSEEGASAQFQIQKLYIKDVSFELPNAPQIFQESGQADVKMTLSQRVDELGDNVHEVVLTVTVTATVGEKTAYLVEVAQGGIFLISGFNEQTKHAVINTLCPGTLFPYARHTISSMVTDGGFPPLTLQPVNFDQLYAQRMQQLMNEQKEGAADQQDSEEIVAAEFKTDD
jgi:preprotein translocase subunit SecB